MIIQYARIIPKCNNSRCEKFGILFKRYGKCHRVFNSSRALNNVIINELEANIITFMGFLRLEFTQIHISPKLHMFLPIHLQS